MKRKTKIFIGSGVVIYLLMSSISLFWLYKLIYCSHYNDLARKTSNIPQKIKYYTICIESSFLLPTILKAKTYHERAHAYQDNKQYKLALKDFTKSLKLTPDDASYFYCRGKLLRDLKKYDFAVKDFSKAIKLDPNDYDYYLMRGITFCFQKQYNFAIKDLNKAMELNPKKYQPYYWRGTAFYHLKSYDKAIKDFNKGIKISTKAALYSGRGKAFYKKRLYEKALSDLSNAIELKPGQFNYYYTRGNIFLSRNQDEKAIADLSKAIELKPDEKKLFKTRGSAFVYTNQNEKALKDFNRAIELDPRSKELPAFKGLVLLKMKNFTGAEKAFWKSFEGLNNSRIASWYLFIASKISDDLYQKGKEKLKGMEIKGNWGKIRTRFLLGKINNGRLLEEADKEENPELKAKMLTSAYFMIATKELRKKDYEKAFKYFQLAEKTGKRSAFEYQISKWELEQLKKAGKIKGD